MKFLKRRKPLNPSYASRHGGIAGIGNAFASRLNLRKERVFMSSGNFDGFSQKRRWYNMEDYDEVPHVHVQYGDDCDGAYSDPGVGYDDGVGEFDDGEDEFYDFDYDPEDDEF